MSLAAEREVISSKGMRISGAPASRKKSEATDQPHAASVPTEISVSMLAEPWRRFRQAARWNGQPAHSTTGVASTMTVNPIAAALLAQQLVGEPLTLYLLLGLVAVFAGIWLATTEGAKLSAGSDASR